MIEFEILAQGLFRPDQLQIVYDPHLTMPFTPEISLWMEELWQTKLHQAAVKNIPLFDAPLYRLISSSTTSDGLLHLTLGNTSYKEYVTTRIPAFADTHPRSELSNALGVCSVVETSDHYILLDRRQGVDVYVGRYHVIGGFFERALDSTGSGQPDPFAAIQREIREETGIQSSDIAEQYCLAAVYDLATPHGELTFLTRLHISLAEVLQRQPEDREIKQLEYLQITPESLHTFIVRNHGNLSATGEPNLLLYGAHLFGKNWYDNLLLSL
ncbi:NUDIX hydrolase [Tengunoibacter tsumagoiensis]|uniref:Nudix hydrolase domain-containing protein n=1 Tax=Tengunoibacter tsumagoiensis TaxID=2014871 RepID=A0A401ZUN6_9CHLR|nr:NUDIX hydrolase [Tengunoibacter tsumagoiensis]GCE10629.1 hypothetical protein KTT_04880 [Tengunoibacter tsumagoiensis]